jgi:hypothetical protein
MVIKPAKRLEEILVTKVVMDRANSKLLELGKIPNVTQLRLCENSEGKFQLEYGPSRENLEFVLSEQEAFDKLAEAISEFRRVRFHALLMPVSRGIDHCSLDLHGNVLVRVIEYYEITIDESLTRYDVLVEKIA